MRIDCPSCAAAYEVPPAILTARRLMRCARCGAEFTPAAPAGTPPTPVEVPVAKPEPFPALLPSPAAPDAARSDDRMGLSIVPQDNPPPRRRAVILAAWLLSFVLLGAGVWAAIAWRDPIMRAWPPSARLYTALGFAH